MVYSVGYLQIFAMYTHGICNIASKWFFGREQLPYNTKKEQAFVENL